MKPDVMLEKLEEAATQMRVKVSYEVLSAAIGHGGLCRVKGEYRVIIDKRASTEERCVTLASALSRVDRSIAAPGVELADDLIALIDQQSTLASGAARPAPPAARAGRARAA
jgi:hypothetical protein